MNKDLKVKLLLGVLAIAGFMFIVGLAGQVDYDEQVILHMSQADYDTIVSRLSVHGSKPSQHEIATYYVNEYSK